MEKRLPGFPFTIYQSPSIASYHSLSQPIMTKLIESTPVSHLTKGPCLMHQNWGSLLFMHWPIPVVDLRPLIPAELSIDEFDGSAWIAVVPFTMWGMRPVGMPPIPGTSAFHELNVRTYVTYQGIPGVWFFSLDANNRLAVWGARSTYSLPYRFAKMGLVRTNNSVEYSSERTEIRFGKAGFTASWSIEDDFPASEPGSLTHFLTERYCLYSQRNKRIRRCPISHPRWPLSKARLNEYSSSMIESLGLKTPEVDPLLHYAEKLQVKIWPLQRT